MNNKANERDKLPRIRKSTPYITGDSQLWTYQYTWEDWEAALNFFCSEYDCSGSMLINFLIDYFTVFPWYIQDHKLFEGHTPGYIRNYFKKKRIEYSYLDDMQEMLYEMWEKMQEKVQNME